jgi:hypothetical protein
MSKKPRIVYTQSTGNKCEYNIYSVETKECLGKTKGDNNKSYWEAFDTSNNFLMSGKRKKDCMDYFREMDTKRLMAKGGGLDNRKLVVLDEGNGKVINDLFTQWNNIKTEKDHEKWNEKVKATTFGTYGNISINEVLDKFEFDKSNINEVQKRDFKAELNNALKYGKGGGMDFEKLSNKVAKNYEGDKVAPKYQHEYGKRYSKEEAKEVGDKVAGKVYWQQQGRKMATGGGVEEYRAKAIERQRKEEEGKTFAQFRAFVYEDSYQFADFKTDDFHKAVKWAKETLEKQKGYRKNSDNLWAIVDEFTPIEKRNNVIYAYSEVARFGEGDMKNMKFKNGGSMPSSSKGFYIVLADGSKKEYSVNNITEIPNIYFAMGTNGIEKGTPMVHHDNILTSVYYANGTPVEAMPQYAGKDYYDFKKKMADGGNVAEDEDYYRVFRNNAGKDIAVKIVKNPIFGKFDYYVDGTLRGQFDSFAQARQEVNYENFDMYKDGGNLDKDSDEYYRWRVKKFGFKPYGKEKGKFKVLYKAEGEPQEEVWETKEMALNTAKRYEKIFSNVKVIDPTGNEIKYARGGGIDKGNYAFVEAETTTGEKVFKFFEDVPTHKEVYAYFRSCKDKNGNPMTLKDATIHIEKVSNFDRELFLEKANEIAMNQFGSPIKELDDLMFAYDKENLSVFKFEAELENGMEVSIEATDGVIIIEAEKDDDDKKYKDGGNLHSSEFYEDGGEVDFSVAKDTKYFRPDDIIEVRLTNGKKIGDELIYSGLYVAKRPFEVKEQYKMFKNGGNLPKSAKYIKRSEIESVIIEDENGEEKEIPANRIVNGIWYDNRRNEELIERARKEGLLPKK